MERVVADCCRYVFSVFSVVLLQDRKANSSASLRGSSASSVLKLTKQRSEKMYSTTVNGAVTYGVGARSCRNGVQIADESVVIASEVLQYFIFGNPDE